MIPYIYVEIMDFKILDTQGLSLKRGNMFSSI